MKKTFFIVLILPALIMSCQRKQVQKNDTEKTGFVLSDTMAKMIDTDTVSFCKIDNALTLNGEINFDENSVVKVYPRSGGQVLGSKITLGDKVEKGQVLAVIKSADVAGNYADLSGAEADINIAKREMENAHALYNNGIASEKDYTEALQNYRKALAAKNKIQSFLNGNGDTEPGGTYIITAPISGYVVEKNINNGAFIRPDNAESLFTISDLKDVWVWANVFEADISKVRPGINVEVTTLAYPGKIFYGKIDKTSEVLDPSNKTMRVLIRLKNPDLLLKPEMFAEVLVTNTESQTSLCVPTKSLISQSGKDYVVVYANNNNMRVSAVNIMKTVGDKTYLYSGVRAGEKVITKNQLLIFQQLLNE